MAFDPGPLLNILSNTKTQVDNPALNQLLKKIINSLVEIQELTFTTEEIADQVASIISGQGGGRVKVVQPNTAALPQTVILADNVTGTSQFVIVKDYFGNAAVNNITLSGTVEGVVDPVINTNFGIFRVYKSSKDGLYKQW